MSATPMLIRVINFKYIQISGLMAFLIMSSGAGQADPATTDSRPSERQAAMSSNGLGGDAPTMNELRSHATTIADILEIASERVERLATTDVEKPALVEAIRHELSLSRRWNRHLGTILDEVAEARLALKEREREAAKEIARMTALAEEARLELMALKKVLRGQPKREVGSGTAWSEGRLDAEGAGEIDRRWASNRVTESAPAARLDPPVHDLQDTRARLLSIQQAQKSASRDVGAVRAKIIEALETLAAAHGDLPIAARRHTGGGLSSEDITAWAASMATKLNREPTIRID